MPNLDSGKYIVGFATVVCIFCSVFVSGANVQLRDKQKANAKLDLQKNVISVSGLDSDGVVTPEDVEKYFDKSATDRVEGTYIELSTGKTVDTAMAETALKKAKEEGSCKPPEDNPAKIRCLPQYKQIYTVYKNGSVDRLILEVEGKGLWSTMYGFLAMDNDGKTIQGLTFYNHGETPGLGGEIDNTKWKASWIGKMAYGNDGEPHMDVKKGLAKQGSVNEIDGLSGATLTSVGVEHLINFWLGDNGYSKYLTNFVKGAQ
jgi:Na+-transporting NADH:ubiquinone oxidoreductase subunit C